MIQYQFSYVNIIYIHVKTAGGCLQFHCSGIVYCFLLLFPVCTFQLDIEVTPTLVLIGSGAFVALWIMSSVISAIDSVPLVRSYWHRSMIFVFKFKSTCGLTCLAYSFVASKIAGTSRNWLLNLVHLSVSPFQGTYKIHHTQMKPNLNCTCCVLNGLKIGFPFSTFFMQGSRDELFARLEDLKQRVI
jgi:hypothetical protein